MEAHGPLHLDQPGYLRRSRRPWRLGTVDDAEEVVKVGGRRALLVAMGSCPDERDVVEW